jgi:PAP2 superfamily
VKKRCRHQSFFLSFFVLLAFQVSSQTKPKKNQEISQEVAIKWAKSTLDFINLQPTKSPTFVSRTLGYIGITMYESVVQSSQKYQSIAPELNGLGELPKPETGKEYDWVLVLNASQSKIIRLLWQPMKHPEYDGGYHGGKSRAILDSLELAIQTERECILEDTAIFNRSIKYGKSIAEAVYEWSKTDGGHEMNFMSFDYAYKYPEGIGYWIPPINGQSPILMPLHPYWGKNRLFVKANADLPIVKMIPYSKEINSDYYKQFKQVYDIQQKLTQEQKEIANWWGDDPAYTTAPPGHSYSIASIILKDKKADLVLSAMIFAKIGIACADAFINCWKNKFTYHSERPFEYIRANIDKHFVQYWPEPPFPGFPSGHSIQMSATAEVLINVFGDKVSFVDNTHQGRMMDVARRVEYKNRRFEKISDIAEECGISRLYGGIHTMQDNLVGLEEGKKIAKNINCIKWKK